MKAFPQKYPLDPLKPYVSESNPLDGGMDLRDYFAAKAMQGLFSFGESVIELRTAQWESDDYWSYIAEHSYLIADAMMEARK